MSSVVFNHRRGNIQAGCSGDAGKRPATNWYKAIPPHWIMFKDRKNRGETKGMQINLLDHLGGIDGESLLSGVVVIKQKGRRGFKKKEKPSVDEFTPA